MTDAELAERVWDCARRIADLGPVPSEDDEEFSAVRLRLQIEEESRELGTLIDDRFRAMAKTAGLNAGEYESIHKHFARLAESDHRTHLLDSLRHLRAALGKREYWAFWIYELKNVYDPNWGGECLRKVFDEVRDLAEKLGIERPIYPEDAPTYNTARNHWKRLREYIDAIVPADTGVVLPHDPQRRAELEEAISRARSRFATFAQVIREIQPQYDAAREKALQEIGKQFQQLSIETSEEERKLFIGAGWENPPGAYEIDRWVAICRQYGIDPDPLALWEVKDTVLARLEMVRVEEAIRSRVRDTNTPKELTARTATEVVKREQAADTGVPALQQNGQAVGAVVVPFFPLTSWAMIFDALNKDHPDRPWKNDDRMRGKIRELNTRFDGPIRMPEGKGKQPEVDRAALLGWWQSVAEKFSTGEIADEQERASEAATVAATHSHGKDGTVVPDIRGSVKKSKRNGKV